jgi:hypothetical protein
MGCNLILAVHGCLVTGVIESAGAMGFAAWVVLGVVAGWIASSIPPDCEPTQCARDRDEEVLGNRVAAGYDFDARSRPCCDLGRTVRDLPDHVVVPEMADRKRRDMTEARDGRGLAVGRGAKRYRALGHVVAKCSPRVDELIELEVQGAEVRAFHVPVGLLSDQREVDELDEHALQLGNNLAVLSIDRHVAVHDERRWHGDLLLVEVATQRLLRPLG